MASARSLKSPSVCVHLFSILMHQKLLSDTLEYCSTFQSAFAGNLRKSQLYSWWFLFVCLLSLFYVLVLNPTHEAFQNFLSTLTSCFTSSGCVGPRLIDWNSVLIPCHSLTLIYSWSPYDRHVCEVVLHGVTLIHCLKTWTGKCSWLAVCLTILPLHVLVGGVD